jgi:tRNA-dihydrouridine synthase A
MMDWTDRHCRYFHRLLSKNALLYTEMVTTGALTHGDVQRHLRFNAEEHPVALQLGGSDPRDLAGSARLGQEWGYDEINLNCGCPSDRVQRGAFGACLMNEPALVADGVKAMRDAVDIPVTVKHRIGVDRIERYEFVRDFVGTVSEAGCAVFIVHARNAWLDGLSPKENREIPPLRYELAYRLKQDFPKAVIVLNGGLSSLAQAQAHLPAVDGVMLGRLAYQEPTVLAEVDRRFFDAFAPVPTRAGVVDAMSTYLESVVQRGVPARAVLRHMLGLYHGQRGGRHWRRMLSDPAFIAARQTGVLATARVAVEQGASGA